MQSLALCRRVASRIHPHSRPVAEAFAQCECAGSTDRMDAAFRRPTTAGCMPQSNGQVQKRQTCEGHALTRSRNAYGPRQACRYRDYRGYRVLTARPGIDGRSRSAPSLIAQRSKAVERGNGDDPGECSSRDRRRIELMPGCNQVRARALRRRAQASTMPDHPAAQCRKSRRPARGRAFCDPHGDVGRGGKVTWRRQPPEIT